MVSKYSLPELKVPSPEYYRPSVQVDDSGDQDEGVKDQDDEVDIAAVVAELVVAKHKKKTSSRAQSRENITDPEAAVDKEAAAEPEAALGNDAFDTFFGTTIL